IGIVLSEHDRVWCRCNGRFCYFAVLEIPVAVDLLETVAVRTEERRVVDKRIAVRYIARAAAADEADRIPLSPTPSLALPLVGGGLGGGTLHFESVIIHLRRRRPAELCAAGAGNSRERCKLNRKRNDLQGRRNSRSPLSQHNCSYAGSIIFPRRTAHRRRMFGGIQRRVDKEIDGIVGIGHCIE